MQALLATSSFSEFIRSDYLIEDQGAHTQARSLTSKSGEILVDFVGRFEEIHRDWKTVCNHLQVDLPLPHVNVGTAGRSIKKEYLKQQDIEYVFDNYRQDFELFGYPKEPETGQAS